MPDVTPLAETTAAGRLPVLLVVDADANAIGAVVAPLQLRYGQEYRVQRLATADAALETLDALAEAGDQVALVLVATSLQDDAAAKVFERARRLHPHAKRTLLVPPDAWVDEDALTAVRAMMSLGRIDSFAARPVGMTDEVFHEAVSGLLLEWTRERRLVPQTVHVVGESWSGRAFELREIFEQCAVPHSFCLADSDEGRALLAGVDDEARLPLLILPDGRVLSDPSDAEIAEAAGAPARLEEREFDVVVVGAGPTGLSSAVYAASEGLRVLVVDSGGIGGQARSSSLIRNYLGFPQGVSGSRLAEQSYQQAIVFGANFLFMHGAESLESTGDGRLAVTLVDGRRVTARAAILATGASYRRLNVPGLEALHGAGVFYGGAAAEAPSLTGKHVFIAGGGNSAGQAALHLARYARSVTLVVRAASLEAGMSSYLISALEATPNVTVRTATEVVGGGGEGGLASLVLRARDTGSEESVDADALFVLIGARPHSGWLPDEIARDSHGFVLTGGDMPEDEWPLARRPLALETSMPGVLAAGDVRHGSVKRVASAVGEGAIAVQLLHTLLADQPVAPSPRLEPVPAEG